MSNKELGQLITEATVYLECWMTVAKIKQMIAQEKNRKAFYSEHKYAIGDQSEDHRELQKYSLV